MVSSGTEITVVAIALICLVKAGPFFLAAVYSAWIIVFAGKYRSGDAAAINTGVVQGAKVPVAAGYVFRLVIAPAFWEAYISCAWVVIVAFKRPGACAASPATDIVGRAFVQVITGLSVGTIGAASSGIAPIVRAWVSVIAGQR